MVEQGISMPGEIDYKLLSRKIAEKRKGENLSLREAAAQCGDISYTTLNRLERAIARPDLDTLQRVLAWLDIPASTLLRGARAVNAHAHLRAQKNLVPGVVESIAKVVHITQRSFWLSTPDQDAYRSATPRVQRLGRSSREDFAVRFRQMINYDLDVPLNPFQLKIKGVEVKHLDKIPNIPKQIVEALCGEYQSLWSAITLPVNDTESAWLIILNPKHTIERKRATLMEEYCHILLGHHLTSLSHVEGQSFRDYNKEQEDDAYGLGAAILVPREALLLHVERAESAKEISKHFSVSPELVEYRIKVTGVWYQYKLRQDVKIM